MIDFALVFNFITYFVLVCSVAFFASAILFSFIATVVGIVRNILGKEEL